MKERLQKVLARAGFGSRRAAEALIAGGRVAVNGAPVTALGSQADPDVDRVVVDGRPIRIEPGRVYLALHKPAGVVTTARDPQRRGTVMDLLPAGLPPHVLPVGRLDRDSEGLLLFTNDGELAYRLSHPRFEIEKEYQALVKGKPHARALAALRTGVTVGGRRTRPDEVRLTHTPDGYGAREGHAWLSLTIHEGRKRQVRLMCAAIGHPVVSLVRTRVANVTLARLPSGKTRHLSRRELRSLRSVVGLEDPSRRDGSSSTDRSSDRSPRAPRQGLSHPAHRRAVPTAAPSPSAPARHAPAHRARARTGSVIAIDGPAAAGKSAIGAQVARRLRYRFIDTGAMYRALTWLAVREGIDPNDETALVQLANSSRMDVREAPAASGASTAVLLDGDDATPHLRDPAVEASVSLVSRVPGVRAALVRIQSALAQGGGIVMAGRDIGTVVLPGADLKVYLDASEDVRVGRRAGQVRAAGAEPDMDGIRGDVARRDALDSGRKDSPLTAAADAVIISTDDMTIEAVVERIVELAG